MMEDYKKALDNLRFSPEAKERLARNLKGATGAVPPRRATGRKRAFAIAAAAAAFALAVGCTAYAANTLSRAGKPAEPAVPPTEVVDGIGRPRAHASANGVTVTAEAVFGGASDYAVVFRVEKDDGTAFEGVEPREDGTLPLEFGGVGNMFMDGTRTMDKAECFYDADPSDHAIQYVRKASLEALDRDRDSIVGGTVKVRFLDLSVLEPDGAVRTLVEGPWKMEFAADYTDQSKTVSGGQGIELGEEGAVIESIALTPVGLSVDLTSNKSFAGARHSMLIDMILASLDEGDAYFNPLIDQTAELQEDLQNMRLGLNMSDGAFVEAPCLGGNSITVEDGVATCSVHAFPTSFVNLDDVVSVTVGDAVVPVAS